MSTEEVRIGKIVGCHGVRGDLKIRPASDSDWVGALRETTLKQGKSHDGQLYKIKKAWNHGPLVLMHLEGVDSRNAAEPLVGSILYANRDQLPAPSEDEFWADDVIGLDVIDAETGRKRGMIKDLLSSGGQDYLEIQLEDNGQTVVIPFLNHFFPEVDLEKKQVTIDLLSDFLAMSSEPVTADRLEQ
jgi:16S rRNA processing protein RimM